MRIPDKLTDFRVYNEGNDEVGVADVELPDFEGETDDLSGAGLAGTISTPALGQFKSMKLGLNFRTPTPSSLRLLEPRVHKLTCYGSIQDFDGSEIREVPCKIYVHALPQKKTTGKFETAKRTGTKVELELTYIKISLDGTDYVELDKLNYIYIVGGTDYLAAVRANLGLG